VSHRVELRSKSQPGLMLVREATGVILALAILERVIPTGDSQETKAQMRTLHDLEKSVSIAPISRTISSSD
jgi:hypothetical protein